MLPTYSVHDVYVCALILSEGDTERVVWGPRLTSIHFGVARNIVLLRGPTIRGVPFTGCSRASVILFATETTQRLFLLFLVPPTSNLHEFACCRCPPAHTLPPCPVSLWKLRPEGLQGEYGKLAPRVTKHEDINSYIGKDGPSATPIPPRVAQGAWLGTALEQLAQMCGAFLGVTVSQPANTSPAGTRLRIDVHVGDALDFCDALLAVPPTVRGAGGNTATSTPIPPVSFQQATLQPLKLKDDVFAATPPAFDVIKSSNLADHLGGLLQYKWSVLLLFLSFCP